MKSKASTSTRQQTHLSPVVPARYTVDEAIEFLISGMGNELDEALVTRSAIRHLRGGEALPSSIRSWLADALERALQDPSKKAHELGLAAPLRRGPRQKRALAEFNWERKREIHQSVLASMQRKRGMAKGISKSEAIRQVAGVIGKHESTVRRIVAQCEGKLVLQLSRPRRRRTA